MAGSLVLAPEGATIDSGMLAAGLMALASGAHLPASSPEIHQNITFLLSNDLEMSTSGGENTSGFTRGNRTMSRGSLPLSGEIRIPLYSIIFFLAIVGNVLVIVTLAQNKRMRTVTNVFLLNLSVSDLLLAVFCMPFTLIPTLLQDFIFGKAMCVLIRYMQAVSVGVSAFTLVAMSLERYFAICQPLRSRSWQTLSHSYKIILAIWLISLAVMVPIAVFQELDKLPFRNAHKCAERWPNESGKKVYTVFLDLLLLIVPLLLMVMSYGAIAYTLWKGIQVDLRNVQEMRVLRGHADDDLDTDDDSRYYDTQAVVNPTHAVRDAARGRINSASLMRRMDARPGGGVRHNNLNRSLNAKRRVIKMLLVVVVEFFVCWTPTYVLQTWYVFDKASVFSRVSPVTMNLVHLLSYVSSCCNPITYCFMNRKFRQGFLSAFRCCPCIRPYWRARANREGSYVTSQRTGKLTWLTKCVTSSRLYRACAKPVPANNYNHNNAETDNLADVAMVTKA